MEVAAALVDDMVREKEGEGRGERREREVKWLLRLRVAREEKSVFAVVDERSAPKLFSGERRGRSDDEG